MDDKKESSSIGGGSSRGGISQEARNKTRNINFEAEFRDSFNKALLYEKLSTTALEYIINKWQTLLGDREYREWDQDMEVGDLWIIGNSLYDYGVDLFSLTSPTTNTAVASDEIIDTGVVTVNV